MCHEYRAKIGKISTLDKVLNRYSSKPSARRWYDAAIVYFADMSDQIGTWIADVFDSLST
jgi:hypothetical protein